MGRYDGVQQAAALMDQHFPGWHRSIDTSELVMSESCKCVLGQHLGQVDGWAIGKSVLFPGGWVTAFFREDPVACAFAYDSCVPAWICEIELRRATEAVLEQAAAAPYVPVQPVSAPDLSSEPSGAPEPVLEAV